MPTDGGTYIDTRSTGPGTSASDGKVASPSTVFSFGLTG